MWKQRVLGNAIWSSADFLLNRLVIIATTNIIVARALLPTEYGIFSTAITLIQSVWLVADLGITQYGIREIARTTDGVTRHRLARDLQSIRFSIAISVFITLLLITFSLPIDGKWKAPIALSGFFLVLYSLSPDWYLKARGHFKRIFFANTVSALMYAGAVYILVTGKTDLYLACFLWAASFLPATIILLWGVFREEGSIFSTKGLKNLPGVTTHLRETKYFFYTSLYGNLYISIPIYLLTLIASETDVGYFNTSYRLYIYIASILLPVSHVFYPVLSHFYTKDDSIDFRNKMVFFNRFAFIIILPAVLLTGIFGEDIILFLYGDLYSEAAWILPYFALPVLIAAFRLTLNNAIAASGNQKYLAYLTFAVNIFVIGLGYFLISTKGITGAVWLVIIGEIIFLLLLLALSRKVISLTALNMLSGLSWKAVLSIVPLFAIVYWGGFSLIKIVIGLVVYAVGLVLTGEVKINRRVFSGDE